MTQRKLAICHGMNGRIWLASQRSSPGSFRLRNNLAPGNQLEEQASTKLRIETTRPSTPSGPRSPFNQLPVSRVENTGSQSGAAPKGLFAKLT